jgi:hypothetical protein
VLNTAAGFYGYPKMTCYAGYAFSKWKYTDPVFRSRIEFVCYKCSECFFVENIYNKDYDFQDDYRQECKAEGYCGAGTEGACTSKCTDCVTGKAGVGSLQQWLHQPAECTACQPGKYAPNKKMTLCSDCASGNVSGTGWDHCDSCAEGKYKKSASECEDCPAGEANPSKAQVSCFPCEKGQYSDKTGLINCDTCVEGKFQDEKGKTTCRKCGAGSFQDNKGQTKCSPCFAGTYADEEGLALCKPCTAGKSSDDGKSVCTNCVPGKYSVQGGLCNDCDYNTKSSTGAAQCTPCEAGKFSYAGNAECSTCTAGQHLNALFLVFNCKESAVVTSGGHEGYFKDIGWVTLSVNGFNVNKQAYTCYPKNSGQQYAYCYVDYQANIEGFRGFPKLYCSAGYAFNSAIVNEHLTRMEFSCKKCLKCYDVQSIQSSDFDFQDNTRQECVEQAGVSLTKPKSETPCLWCAQCPLGTERARCLPNTTDPGVCMSCEAGTRLVLATGICEPCQVNEYREINDVTRLQQTKCTACPLYSTGPAGSNSLQNCVCNEGFVPIASENGDFICGCEFGRYIVGNVCQECGECIHGYYRFGCVGDKEGSCVPCKKECSADKQLAGCGGMHAGTCKKKSDLVRTPMCPVKQDFQQGLLSASAGFGFYDFTSVFRASALVLNFRCSDVCDGTTSFDTIECDGPYACNMATCAEDITQEGNMIPVRACPVIITNDDDDNIIQQKRKESCVACKDCGYANYLLGSEKYNDWGAGCVRECSQLLCTAGMLWDWTKKRCSACENLNDIRLCNKRDTESMSLLQSTITGNLPLLFFANCKAGGRNLYDISYGTCMRCDQNKQQCSSQSFPARCKNGASVLCKTCSRTTQSLYVDVQAWRWIDAAQQKQLHCQISACKTRNGLQWTGVDSSGKLCRRICASIVCAANERLVPCRLPHQARCEALFPALSTVAAEMQTNIFYVGEEVNLLEESKKFGDVSSTTFARGVASFENIVMVLPSTLEYQCVWNADGIIDNTATPAGISHVFWAPGQTADDLYRKRGTRACRVWEVPVDVDMPLLPLQNTVSCSEQEDNDSKCADRFMLTNTEAYALSYKFSGEFGVDETSYINAQFAASSARMLQGEHVGNTGSLYLMLRMYQNNVRVAANVPNDRGLYSAPWLRALLVSFAVVDLTEYSTSETNANVRVVPIMSVNGQAISDDADSFIPEYFWSQAVSGNEWQHADSMFSIHANGFAGQTQCSNEAFKEPFAQLQLAPWNTSLFEEYTWLQQRHNTSVIFEVTMKCLLNNILSDCFDLQKVVEVYVLLNSFESIVQTNDHFCDTSFCTDTTDTILKALQKVHRIIPATPIADRLTANGAARVQFPLQYMENLQIRIQQAHTISAYAQCAVMLTTSIVNTYDAVQQNVVCVGGDGVFTVRSAIRASKFSAAFSAKVQDTSVLLMLLGSLNQFYKSLQWQNMTHVQGNTTESYEVLNSDQFASTWITAAVIENNLTALYIDFTTSSVAVGFFQLQQTSLTEITLQERETAVFLSANWNVHVHEWQDYSRVLVSLQTENVLVATVEVQTSEILQATSLQLRVCVCSWTKASVCSDIGLQEMSVSATASFISAAYIQQASGEDLWVVSVSGKVHQAIFAQNTLILQRILATDLEHKHFVKVDHLFYCFTVSNSDDAVQPSVLTYLPHFKTWRTTTYASLSAVYAVVLLPLFYSQNATLLANNDNKTLFSAQDDNITTLLSNNGTTQSKDSLFEKKLLLELRMANYHVPSFENTAQPLYERTAQAPTTGDELEQLIVSPHSINAYASARTLLSSYGISKNNLTLTRALGLPLSYGMYERFGFECTFEHRQTASLVEQKNLQSCTEEAFMPLTVSSATCDDESMINGMYTFYNWTNPDVVKAAGVAAMSESEKIALNSSMQGKQVYVKQISLTSYDLPSASRFLYHIHELGWIIAEVLGSQPTPTCIDKLNARDWEKLPAECGNIFAIMQKNHDWSQNKSLNQSLQICRDKGENYYASDTPKLTVTLTPKCCAAGHEMLSGICTACTAGKYSKFGWNVCEACTPGKYSAFSASSECTACATNTHAPEFGSETCTDCPTTSLCAHARQKPAIALFYEHQTNLGLWLHLLFSVPCGSRLQPFASVASQCDFSAIDASETICSQSSTVLLLIHAQGEAQSRMIYHEQNNRQTLLFPHSDCVYMELGVTWFDAAVHDSMPSHREIDMFLQRSLQTSALSEVQNKKQSVETLPPPGTWRRERHVMTATFRKDMLLELLFKRNDVDSRIKVAVGLDDVQITPVLTDFPATVEAGVLCTLLRVPAAHELSMIGLQHLLRGNHSQSHDDWERLHVNVGLSTERQELAACTFTASLFYALQESSCIEDPQQPAHMHNLHRIGCSLVPSTNHVVGAYAECQISVPTFLSNVGRIGIAVHAAESTLENTTCALRQTDDLVVSLRAYTQFFSCPAGQFLDLTGTCISCHKTTSVCPLGSRLRGCPALEPAAAENCVQCTEGREFVASGAAQYVARDNEPCHWNCSAGYFLFEILGERSCRKCQLPPESGCDAGFVWQECSHSQDSACVPCPDLRLTSGPYANNEEYLEIVNKSNTCQTQCKAESYRSADGLCKKCWDRAQLLLHSGSGFFFFEPCTNTSNARAVECVAKPGELIVANDPGEGTIANPFVGRCVIECLPGWYAFNNACKQCWPPLQIVEGALTGAELPDFAYSWKQNGTTPCTYDCKSPYTRTSVDAAVQTCVLCSDVCVTGEYPSGPYCKCASCLM